MGLHKHLCTPVNTVYLMHEYYREGHSIRATAARFNVSPKTVHACFHRHGLYVRTVAHALIKYHSLDSETQLMYQDRLNGMTVKQIAAKYHYSEITIYRRIHRRHLKRRVGGEWWKNT